jgi:hypothetical protein
VIQLSLARIVVLLLALALLGAGCGGDTNTDVAAPETVTEAGGDTVEAPVDTDNNEPETQTAPEAVTCSATDSGLALEEQELPKPVADLRERLFAAAGQCDYEQLSEIAQESEGFTYTFGGTEGAPAKFWREQEEGATGEPMYALQMVLSLPVARTESGGYVWPSAHSPNATDADWQALVDENFYFSSDIEMMREGGTGYVGWRTAITADGEWQYFAEGD